jgi:hypothetical protein
MITPKFPLPSGSEVENGYSQSLGVVAGAFGADRGLQSEPGQGLAGSRSM